MQNNAKNRSIDSNDKPLCSPASQIIGSLHTFRSAGLAPVSLEVAAAAAAPNVSTLAHLRKTKLGARDRISPLEVRDEFVRLKRALLPPTADGRPRRHL